MPHGVALPADRARELPRQRDDAALALDRLQQERRHEREGPLDDGDHAVAHHEVADRGALLGDDPPEGVGTVERDEPGPVRQRRERGPVGGVVRQLDTADQLPVEGTLQGQEDRRPRHDLRVRTGDLLGQGREVLVLPVRQDRLGGLDRRPRGGGVLRQLGDEGPRLEHPVQLGVLDGRLDRLGPAVGEDRRVLLVGSRLPADDAAEQSGDLLGARVARELGVDRDSLVEEMPRPRDDLGMVMTEDQRAVASRGVQDRDLLPVVASEEQRIPLGPRVFDIETDGGEETEQIRLGDSGFIGYGVHDAPSSWIRGPYPRGGGTAPPPGHDVVTGRSRLGVNTPGPHVT